MCSDGHRQLPSAARGPAAAFEIAGGRRRALPDQVGGLLGDHNHYRIGIPADDGRHDGGSTTRRPWMPARAQLRVDDGVGSRAHAAGADLVVDGVGAGADEFGDLRVALHAPLRARLPSPGSARNRRREDPARQLEWRANNGSMSPSTDSSAGSMSGARVRVRDRQADAAAALGIQAHRADRIAVPDRQRETGLRSRRPAETQTARPGGRVPGCVLRKATDSNTLLASGPVRSSRYSRTFTRRAAAPARKCRRRSDPRCASAPGRPDGRAGCGLRPAGRAPASIPSALQLGGGPDARKQQQLRRLHGAGAQDHFARRPHLVPSCRRARSSRRRRGRSR